MGLSFDIYQCFPSVSALYCCAHVFVLAQKKQVYQWTDGQNKFTITSLTRISTQIIQSNTLCTYHYGTVLICLTRGHGWYRVQGASLLFRKIRPTQKQHPTTVKNTQRGAKKSLVLYFFLDADFFLEVICFLS